MSHTKEAPQRKCRTNAVPMLAGLSLSLASGPAAAIDGISQDLAISAPIARQVMDEEEIFDVRLATFRVFDGESANAPRTRPTIVGAGACGIGLYHPQDQSALSGPVYQTPRPFRPRPTRPANKYKRRKREARGDLSVEAHGKREAECLTVSLARAGPQATCLRYSAQCVCN